MKKIIALALSLILTLCALPVFADGVWGGLNASADGFVSYEVPEMGVTISVPDTMLVYTRGMAEDDPAFAALGVNKATIDAHFEANAVYFNAVIPDVLDEVVCTMSENAIKGFSLFTQTDLENMIPTFREQYEAAGYHFIDAEVVEHPQTLMMKLRFSFPDDSAYCLQYYVIRNYKALNFNFNSYGKDLTPEYEQLMHDIVMSINFAD